MRPEMRRGFRVPLVPLVPILGILLQLALAVFLFFYSPIAWLSAGVWIAAGLGVFYSYSRRRDHAYAQVVAGREAAERREYRILACIGSLHRAPIVLNAAAVVARYYDAEIVVMSVVEMSDRDMLAQGLDQAKKVREDVWKTIEELDLEDIPLKVVVKVSHRISYAVTETALEEQCNLIVLGRARRVDLIERLAATIVDRVVRSAPVQVMLVTADHWPKKIENVLLAYEHGPHSALSVDLAAAFGRRNGATVRAVEVLPPHASSEELQNAKEEMAEEVGQLCPPDEQLIVQAGDIVTGLLRHSGDSDLFVVGGTDAGMLEQLLGYAPPLELADRTKRPMLTVYEMAAEPKRWIS
jgi:nucleotide-binding universal stress UspA family protein